MAVDRYAAEDRAPLGPGPSAHMMPAYTPLAAGAQLIDFYCLVCDHLLRAEVRQPIPAPMCTGSKARTGKQHELARMELLFLD